jgi:hypothetical protein
MYRRTSAVGTGIDDHSITQLAQLVSETPGGGGTEQLGRAVAQPKQEAQQMSLTGQTQLNISHLTSDLRQLSQLVQPSPQPHRLLGMPFEMLPEVSPQQQPIQGSPPPSGGKRGRSSLGISSLYRAPDMAAGGLPPPKSPRHGQWGSAPSGGFPHPHETTPVVEMGMPAMAGPLLGSGAEAAAQESGTHAAATGILGLKEVQGELAWEDARLMCGLLLDVCSPAQAGVLLTQGFPYTTDVALLLQLLNQERKREARD